jgi:hypothetical protein
MCGLPTQVGFLFQGIFLFKKLTFSHFDTCNNNMICGILDIDYPELSGDQRRQIQLGELTVLPDGKTITEYAAEIELLKEISLEEEANVRTESLVANAEDNQPKYEGENEEERASEDSDDTDEDPFKEYPGEE